MKKVIRLTENDLVRIIKQVIMEENSSGEVRHNYTQKVSHSLISKDGKRFNLPSGHVWNHKCFGASEADWLEDSKYGIEFNCGDANFAFDTLNAYGDKEPMHLKNFENSEPLLQSLKKEYCKGNQWDNSPSSKHPGCFIQRSWKRQGGKY